MGLALLDPSYGLRAGSPRPRGRTGGCNAPLSEAPRMSNSNELSSEHASSSNRNNTADIEPPALVAGVRGLLDWRAHSRLGRIVVTSLIVMVIGVVIGAPTLSYGGFCFSQARFLSDREYEDIAIRQIMSLPCYQTIRANNCVPPIRYSDVADFRARNPDCCRFVRHRSDFEPREPTFRQQLFGRAARSILVNFRINYTDADGIPRETIGPGLIIVGNCGRVL